MQRFKQTALRWRVMAMGMMMMLATGWGCAADAAIGDRALVEGSLVNGKKFTIEAQHGKVVLVVLWAAWCPVCNRELPKLEKFYRENAAKGFEIVALSVDDTPLKVRQYLAGHPFSFPVGWRNNFKDNLGPVNGTPTWVLVDRQGVMRSRTEGALDDGGWWTLEDEIDGKSEPHACADRLFFPTLLRRAL